MTTDETTYQEALQIWLYTIPLAELTDPVRPPIQELRIGNIAEEEAKQALFPYRSLILQWHKNNFLLNNLLKPL